VSVTNIGEPVFDEPREVEGFRTRRARLGRQLGTERLSVSTHGTPDIVFYPDSGKVGVSERLPRGGGIRHDFRIADAVDYYDGET
jgi:hypothetical protein